MNTLRSQNLYIHRQPCNSNPNFNMSNAVQRQLRQLPDEGPLPTSFHESTARLYNEASHPSFGGGEQLPHDSGYYGTEVSTNIEAIDIRKKQTNPSDRLAKWDSWLHEWYVNCGRKQPGFNELFFLGELIKVPENAIQVRFRHYHEMDFPIEDDVTSGRGVLRAGLFHANFSHGDEMDLPALPREVSMEMDDNTADASNAPAILEAPSNPGGNFDTMNQAEVPSSEGKFNELSLHRGIRMTPGLRELTATVTNRQKSQLCKPPTGVQKKQNKYACTLGQHGSGWKFRAPCEQRRHEEVAFPQRFWFCSLCGDTSNPLAGDLFVRKDKFQKHVSEAHPGWNVDAALSACELSNPHMVFPRRCGFCPRSKFYAQSWIHRSQHIASHFRKGAKMENWREWPENDDNDERRHQPPLVPFGSSSGDNDDDDDDDDDDNGDNSDGSGDEPPHEEPPAEEPPDDFDFGGGSDSLWSPSDGGGAFAEVMWFFLGLQCFIQLRALEGRQWGNKTQAELPIVFDEKINQKGGTSSIFKVTIPEKCPPWTYTLLTTTHNPHRFAVKQYLPKDRDTFEREASAYSKLDGSPGILRCYGTFEYEHITTGLTYNLLLEYADCDLNQYWENSAPPESTSEIESFYSSLHTVIEGLSNIHRVPRRNSSDPLLFGWHADIKPDNILSVGGRFKLADFGFSTFNSREAYDPFTPITQIIPGGTDIYAAPELARSKHYRVSQSIDIWSLGCVLSLAATWVVAGTKGLQEYEQRRLRACQRLHGDSALPTFHDGFQLLDEAKIWHKYLKSHAQEYDKNTEHLIAYLHVNLLRSDPDMRDRVEKVGRLLCNSNQLIYPNPIPAPWEDPYPLRLSENNLRRFLNPSSPNAPNTSYLDGDPSIPITRAGWSIWLYFKRGHEEPWSPWRSESPPILYPSIHPRHVSDWGLLGAGDSFDALDGLLNTLPAYRDDRESPLSKGREILQPTRLLNTEEALPRVDHLHDHFCWDHRLDLVAIHRRMSKPSSPYPALSLSRTQGSVPRDSNPDAVHHDGMKSIVCCHGYGAGYTHTDDLRGHYPQHQTHELWGRSIHYTSSPHWQGSVFPHNYTATRRSIRPAVDPKGSADHWKCASLSFIKITLDFLTAHDQKLWTELEHEVLVPHNGFFLSPMSSSVRTPIGIVSRVTEVDFSGLVLQDPRASNQVMISQPHRESRNRKQNLKFAITHACGCGVQFTGEYGRGNLARHRRVCRLRTRNLRVENQVRHRGRQRFEHHSNHQDDRGRISKRRKLNEAMGNGLLLYFFLLHLPLIVLALGVGDYFPLDVFTANAWNRYSQISYTRLELSYGKHEVLGEFGDGKDKWDEHVRDVQG
ncbi:hypothetical protein P154DRAFT_320396 [Amniculicola lignicola CBS 123094]|uniref:Protein kinase domain-containing protein n=1 Tax=Amniculicola lignicola CBS 123094 TaxID=1392246 RepID=A0A6A5W5A1_9PLEO|nr:hypothetical protein P154DRAFT_320396 [Amniculicola lignicola CBS 123094]